MIAASELRSGMALRLDGQLYKVVQSEFKAGGGQAGGNVKSLLQNVDTGRTLERRFHPEEKLDELPIKRRDMEFIYFDGDHAVFMDSTNYEQVEISRSSLGKMESFVQPGTALPVEFCDERPISVSLPDIVEGKIAETAPPQHSGQDSAWKEAVLDNGVQVLVPMFIGPGEVVRVETKTGKYLERVKGDKKKIA